MKRGFIGLGAKDGVSAGLSLNDEAFVSSVLAFLMWQRRRRRGRREIGKSCDGESFHRLSLLSDAPYSSSSSYLHAIKVGRERRERW